MIKSMDGISDRNKVSIIVPVFNAEQYLEDTLNSIVNQTYSNLEILLVDDGSTDSSVDICDTYARNDDRIHVYHIENIGASRARNYAVDRITGDWVAFIDSDDIVSETYLEEMIRAGIETNKEIVTCRYYNGEKYSLKEFHEHFREKNPQYEIIGMDKFRYTNKYSHTTVWAGLYRKELIQNHYFDPELYVGEDTYYFAELLKKEQSLVFIDEVYYYYRYQPKSLAHNKFNIKQVTEIVSWKSVCELFQTMDVNFTNECYAALGLRYKKVLSNALRDDYQNSELIKEMEDGLKEYVKYVVQSKELSSKIKLSNVLFSIAPRIYCKIKKQTN